MPWLQAFPVENSKNALLRIDNSQETVFLRLKAASSSCIKATKWSRFMKRFCMSFQSLLILLQNLPTIHWGNEEVGLLLAEAYRLKYMFADAPSHYKRWEPINGPWLDPAKPRRWSDLTWDQSKRYFFAWINLTVKIELTNFLQWHQIRVIICYNSRSRMRLRKQPQTKRIFRKKPPRDLDGWQFNLPADDSRR